MKTFTCNGCFDALHAGHMFFLGYCRALAKGKLIVGINSDEHIRSVKGREPHQSQDVRKAAIESLNIADEVQIFFDTSAVEFIKSANSDTHFISEEYGKNCPEYEHMGKDKSLFVPRVGDWATSANDGYSFCIITNGKRPDKMKTLIESIRALNIPKFEIIISGYVSRFEDKVDLAGTIKIELSDAANNGLIGEMRNRAVENTRYDTVVVCDDDLIFQNDFYRGVERFGVFEVLCVKFLNPDGSRYWDWASSGGTKGHRLLDYDETDDFVYVTGGLCVMKKNVAERVVWNEKIPIGCAEDVDFSSRLKKEGISIQFCQNATVIHDDKRMTQRGRIIINREQQGPVSDVDYELTFKHSGARGDIIYALPMIKALGGGILYINLTKESYIGKHITPEDFLLFAKLLKTQSYITDVREWNQEGTSYDIDTFRVSEDLQKEHLAQMPLNRFKVDADITEPWLEVGDEVPYNECWRDCFQIIINRSKRYHGNLDWEQLRPHQGECKFVGFKDEYDEFIEYTGLTDIDYYDYSCKSYMNLVEIIKQSKLFIGNQSFCWSLAEAMKVPRVLESFFFAPNCNPMSDNGYIRLTNDVIQKHVFGKDIQIDNTESYRKTRVFERTVLFNNPSLKTVDNRPLTSVILPVNSDTDLDLFVGNIPSVGSAQYQCGINIICDDDEVFNDLEEKLGDLPSRFEISLVCLKGASFGSMCNWAVDTSLGDYVVIISDPIRLSSRWDKRAITDLLKTRVEVAGISMAIEDQTPYLESKFMIMSRRVIQHVGLFEDKGCPEAEFTKKLMRYGYGVRKITVPHG